MLATRTLSSLGAAVSKEKLQCPVEGNISNPLEDYAEYLASETVGILRKTDVKSGGVYQIQLERVMKDIKIRLIENIVQESCGAIATRLWRLLRVKEKLDDKNVMKSSFDDDIV